MSSSVILVWETGLGRIILDPPSSLSWEPGPGSCGPLEGTGGLGDAWGGGGGGIPPIVSSSLIFSTNSFCVAKPVLPRTTVRATTALKEDDSVAGLCNLTTRGILGGQGEREPSGTPGGIPRGITSAAKHPTEA